MANRFLSNITINDAYTFPSADGENGQIITTDGSGNLSFTDISSLTGAQSNFIYYTVKNSSGATINKGAAVMAVGTDGNSGHILIDEMVADGTVEAKYFMGVLESTLANGEIGRVIHFGELDQFNTSTFQDGDVLWCDPSTPGGFTTTEPLGPNLKLATAIVINASTNGKIKIRVQGNAGLHELHDVKITTQANGEILVWDNTTGVWMNDGTLTVDYTNGRVGIGTSMPSSLLHLVGNSAAVRIEESGGAQVRMAAGGSTGYIGTYSNHELQFLINGNNAITVNTSRNVGIGTTSPYVNLTIKDADTQTTTGLSEALRIAATAQAVGNKKEIGFGPYESGEYPHITLGMEYTSVLSYCQSDFYIATRGNTTNSAPTERFRIKGDGNASFSGDLSVEDNIYLTDAGTVRGKFQLNSSDRDDVDIKAVSLGSNMKFFTVDTERMRIDSSGNISIYSGALNLGTDSVASSINSIGDLFILNVDSNNNTGGTPNFRFRIGSTTDISTIDNTGIYLHGNSRYFTATESTNNYEAAQLGADSSGDGNFVLRNSSNSVRVKLYAEQGAYNYIDNGGNFGIGYTTPSYKLDVNGVARANRFISDTSSTGPQMTLSYEDQNKKIFNIERTFTFTGQGVYYFNLAFASQGGFGFDVTMITARNSNYRNFGMIKDSGYMYWEADGDFVQHVQGESSISSTYNGGIYLDDFPTTFGANNTTDTSAGTLNYSYYIKRYAIYLPDNTTGSDGFFRVTVETHGYTGDSIYFLNA